MLKDNCPCGLRRAYLKCCGRYISGAKIPPIAEALMRSRYTAFAMGEVEYLLATWADETKANISAQQLNDSCSSTEYLSLKILSKSAGTRTHIDGKVEFSVCYKSKSKTHTHHEFSRFVKTNGCWKYLDGDVSIS